MAMHEASQGDKVTEAIHDPFASRALRRLQCKLEMNRSPKLLSPVAAPRSSHWGPQRCRSLSPLANSTPVLATQRSMVTLSNDSFRPPSVLDDIPTNLLRRYPRFSTATTSIETGRPNFSIEELNSTQLSDDEDDIVNNDAKQSSRSRRALLKHRVASDAKAIWSSRTSRFKSARERLKTWPHKITPQSIDQQHHSAESLDSHVSTVTPDRINALPVATPTSDKVTSSTELDECEATSAIASASALETNEAFEVDHRSELGKRVATMIRNDIQQEHQACSQRRSLRYAASAIQMTSPQVAGDRSLLGRQSFLAPLKGNPRMPSMATLETVRAGKSKQGGGYRPGSLSHIRRTSQPPSRPSTMRGRQSFSSSVNQPKAESLFMDTPEDPGTSFVFPSSKAEPRPRDVEESRPVSNAGSVFSFQTTVRGSANDACPQVEFGRPLPQGYQKVPAYTIRRIERNDTYGLDSASLPTLPDSPITFQMHTDLRDKKSIAQRPKNNESRASKWSTNVQTNVQELQEQEILVEDPPEGTKKENFAVRGCQKTARALSHRIGSDSLQRFRSQRWKAGRVERATPTNAIENNSLVLSEQQVNLRVESEAVG